MNTDIPTHPPSQTKESFGSKDKNNSQMYEKKIQSLTAANLALENEKLTLLRLKDKALAESACKMDDLIHEHKNSMRDMKEMFDNLKKEYDQFKTENANETKKWINQFNDVTHRYSESEILVKDLQNDLKIKVDMIQKQNINLSEKDKELVKFQNELQKMTEQLNADKMKYTITICEMQGELEQANRLVQSLQVTIKTYKESENAKTEAELENTKLLEAELERISTESHILRKQLTDEEGMRLSLATKLEETKLQFVKYEESIQQLSIEKDQLQNQIMICDHTSFEQREQIQEMQISDLQGHVDKLKNDLESSLKRINDLSMENDKTIKENDEIKIQRQSSEYEIQTLRAQLELLNEEMNETMETMNETQNDMSRQKDIIEELQKDIQEKQEQVDIERGKRESAEKALSLKSKENIELEHELKSFKDSSSNSSQIIQTHTEIIEKFEFERNQLISTKEKLETHLQELMDKNTYLEEECTSLSIRLEETKVKLDSKDENLLSLTTQFNELNSHLTLTKEHLENVRKEKDNMTASGIEYKNKNLMLLERVSSLEKALDDMKNCLYVEKEGNSNLRTKLSQSEISLKEVEEERNSQIDMLKEKVHSLETLNLELEQDTENVRTQNMTLNSLVKDLEYELKSLNADIESKLVESTNRTELLMHERDAYKEQAEKANALSEEHKKRIEEIKNELQTQLQVFETRMKDIDMELSEKSEILAKITLQFNDLERLCTQKDVQIEELKKEQTESLSGINELEKARSELEDQLKVITERYVEQMEKKVPWLEQQIQKLQEKLQSQLAIISQLEMEKQSLSAQLQLDQDDINDLISNSTHGNEDLLAKESQLKSVLESLEIVKKEKLDLEGVLMEKEIAFSALERNLLEKITIFTEKEPVMLATIETLNSKCSQLENELEEGKTHLFASEGIVKSLKFNEEDLKGRLRNLEASLECISKQKERADVELVQMKEEFTDKQILIEECLMELECKNQQIAKGKEIHDNMTADIEKLKPRVATLQSELTETKSNLNDLEKVHQSLLHSVNKFSAANRQLEQGNKEKEIEIKKWITIVDEHKEKIQELNAILADKEESRMKERIELETKISQADQIIDAKTALTVTLKQENSEKMEEIIKLQKQISELEVELQGHSKELQEEAIKNRDLISEMERNLESLEDEKLNLLEELDSKNLEIEQLQKELNEKLGVAQKTIKELGVKYTSLQESNDIKDDDISTLKRNLSKAESTAKSFEEEISLQNQVIVDLKNEISHYETKIESLNSEVMSKSDSITSYENDIVQLKQERVSALNDLKLKEQEISTLQEECHRRQDELISCRESLNAKQNEVEKILEDLLESKEKNKELMMNASKQSQDYSEELRCIENKTKTEITNLNLEMKNLKTIIESLEKREQTCRSDLLKSQQEENLLREEIQRLQLQVRGDDHINCASKISKLEDRLQEQMQSDAAILNQTKAELERQIMMNNKDSASLAKVLRENQQRRKEVEFLKTKISTLKKRLADTATENIISPQEQITLKNDKQNLEMPVKRESDADSVNPRKRVENLTSESIEEEEKSETCAQQ